ncbi:hypothetical protein [Pseudomonas sp. CM27]|uniref:hypothetical protein n=1 Tax=Pseudomonas sp. CM27 TaxID=2738452 RepID=UPI0015547B3F
MIETAVCHEIVQGQSSTATSRLNPGSAPRTQGRNVRPGTHVDLVGGFRPDMQEADTALMAQARVFVDDRKSAAVAGDILIALAAGALAEDGIEGDLFDICQRGVGRRERDEITVYRNARGAHLDLVTSQYVMSRL